MDSSPFSERRQKRQSRPPERFKDGGISWEQVAQIFPDMDDDGDQGESDPSGDGSDYGEDDDEQGDANFEADTEEEEEMPIDPSLLQPEEEPEPEDEDMQDDFKALVEEMNREDNNGLGRDFSMTEQEMDYRQNLRAAAGIGKPRKRGRRRGRAKYSDEVRSLLSDAQHAFIEQDLDSAIRLAREAVRIEPRAAEGWSVLSGVYSEMGDQDGALKFRIMRAHMGSDAGEWKTLAGESLEMDLPRQALYCYRKAIQVDRKDQDAIWDRAFLLKGIGDFEQALKGFTELLAFHPYNPTVLLQIYQISLELRDLQRPLQLYQAAFAYYLQFPPNEELFGIPSLSILADLQINTGNLESAIQTVKSGTRWLQNRANEAFWELVGDDREYDPQGYVREQLEGQEEEVEPGYHPLPFELRQRLAVARLKGGDDSEAQIHVDVIRNLDKGLHPEYFEYMIEIGDAYFERELWEEAYSAYDDVHGAAEVVSRHLLMQMGRCLRNLGRVDDAIRVLEQVLEVAPDSMDAKLDLVELLEASGQLERAYQTVLQIKEARQRERRQRPEPDRSAEPAEPGLFTEVRTSTSSKTKITAEEWLAVEEQRTQVVLAIHERLMTFEEAADAGDAIALEEWMFQARRLIDTFRQARQLFPADPLRKYTGFFGKGSHMMRAYTRRSVDIDQNVADISTRLQESIADKVDESSQMPLRDYSASFRGIGFDEWMRLIITYAFRLVRRGEYLEAINILRHCGYSIVFRTKKYEDAFTLATLSAAIFQGDYATVKENARKLIYTHQFNNEAIRLFLATLPPGLEGFISFTDTKFGKFITREMKIGRLALAGDPKMRWNSRGRWVQTTLAVPGVAREKDNDDEDASSGDESAQAQQVNRSQLNVKTSKRDLPKTPIPTKENPVVLTLYGQVLMSVKSYQGALFYFMHAYELNPYDPLLCLCTAVSYLGRSTQRLSDNRHHQIVQGLAFLTRYRTIRESTHDFAEETEYNFGRYFHQINVLHLATKHYRRALDIARQRLKAGEAVPSHAPVKEAAYNLSLIYATTGAPDISRVLYEEWLTI